MWTYITATESGEYVPHNIGIEAVGTDTPLQLTQQISMLLHDWFQLCGEEESEVARCNDVLQSWEIAVEKDLEISDVLTFRVYDLTKNHVATICEGGGEGEGGGERRGDGINT